MCACVCVLLELEKLKANYDVLLDIKTEGAIRWYEAGETNSQYFIKLEKRNRIQKTISRLKVNKSIIADDKEILHEQERFYTDLYSSKIPHSTENTHNTDNEFFNPEKVPKISNDIKQTCEGKLTIEECKKALLQLSKKKHKSPGVDGLTTEFYVTFWDLISDKLVQSLNYAFMSGTLSVCKKQGAIT